MIGWRCSGGAIGEWTVPSGESATRPRRTSPAGFTVRRIAVALVAVSTSAAVVRAGDTPTLTPAAMWKETPAITLEVPHPALLIDRLTDPRLQQALGLLPQYR